MKYLGGWAQKVRREEWLAIVLFVVGMAINIGVYQQKVGPLEALRLMVYYFSFGEPFYGLFFLAVYSLALFDFYKYLAQLIINWLTHHVPPVKNDAIILGRNLFKPLRVILPIGLTTLPMYQLLTHFSYQLRFSGHDLWLATLDKNLLGLLPFVYLPTKFSVSWFSYLMYYSYLSLALAISSLLAFLFLFKKEKLFRLAVAAFVFSFIFAYPFFYYVPCQDPSHFFINNDRGNAWPESVNLELVNYHPSPETKKLINKIDQAEIMKKQDNAVPISCFPSMHAVWGLIVIVFLFCISPYSLLLSAPWLITVLTGGLYFGQHYFVDYLMAIPIAAISLLAGYGLLKKR